MKKIVSTLLISLSLLFMIFSTKSIKNAEASTSILNTGKDLGIFRDLTSEEIVEYYSDIKTGTKGEALLESLQPILKKNQIKLNYGSGDTTSKNWNGYYLLERDWQMSPLTEDEISSQVYKKSNLWLNILYSTQSIKFGSVNNGTFEYYDNEELKSIAYKNNSVQVDREHVLPKSFGFNGSKDRYKNLTAGCDMQNLHAGEHNGNSTGHSNYPYGTVVKKDSTTAITSGITKEVIGYTGLNEKGIKVFEPLDVDKGDIARTIFYMCARYHTYEELGNGDNTPAISLSNSAESTTTLEPEDTINVPACYGELDDLLAWNKLDPVDEFEIHRNNLCYNAIQHNRNPFIDYPEWADVAFKGTSYGINLDNKNGIDTNNFTITSTLETLEKGNTLDLSKILIKYNNGSEDVTLTLADLSYEVYCNLVKIDVSNLKEYEFIKKGKYSIIFSYTDTSINKTFSDTIEFNVLSYDSIKIDNPSSIKTTLKKGEFLDLSSLSLKLYNKDVALSEVKDYTVGIYDSDNKLVSSDKAYKFEKTGTYTVKLSTTVDGEVLETSFTVEVSLDIVAYIPYIIAAIIIIVILLTILVVVNNNKSKKRSTTRKSRSGKKKTYNKKR